MKKFLSIIILSFIVLFSIQVKSQTIALAQMGTGSTYQLFTTDYTLTNTTVRIITFKAPYECPTTQDVTIQLDSLTGDHTNVAVALYGQKSAIVGDYTQIGSTVNWKGTTNDTTFTISNATPNRYLTFKLVYTGTGVGTTKINNQEFKFWKFN